MNQTSTNPILISPFFCFKMKPSSFFIMFSVVAITLHLVIPFLVGKEFLKEMQANERYNERIPAYEKVKNFDAPKNYPEPVDPREIVHSIGPTLNNMEYSHHPSIKNRILSKSQISDHQDTPQFEHKHQFSTDENYMRITPNFTPETNIPINQKSKDQTNCQNFICLISF